MSTLLAWLDTLLTFAVAVAEQLHEFYAKNLRGSLFSGFLTLSGFLFSINTFIVVNMKKELYDHEDYLKRVVLMRTAMSAMTVYGPLRRLSRLLLLAVCSSVAASVVQFTVGLVRTWYTATFCLLVPIVAIVYLAKVLVAIRRNLRDLFEFQEELADKKIKAILAANAASAPAENAAPQKAIEGELARQP